MWKSISSLVRFTKKQVDSAKKAISKYAGQVINLVPEPIRRTVNTVTGNLMTKINEIFENKKKLPPNAVEESSPQQEVVTNKTEIKSTPNETGKYSAPQEVVTNKTEIKLVENGVLAKVFKTTGNLNFDLTDIIMEKITPIIEMRTRIIHAFSCLIYRGQGEIIEYNKTFKIPEKTFSSLAEIKEVPEDQIPQHMQDYKINTGRKKIKNNKKLLGVMKAEKILFYSPLLKWYLNHGLQVTKIHKYISYTSGTPFAWFPEEVSSARRAADNDKNKKQLGDTAKLKGNSFYGKMIENLEKHMNTKFTTDEKLIDKIFRSPFFEDLEEINEGVFEVRQRKRQVTITRPYQCGIAVYQLAKLRMLEFYYDFLDKFCDRRDFELIQMDTDSFYMAPSAEDFDDIIKPEMKELYKEEKKNWLVTDEYSKRVPGLFKPEFKGKRMIALTSKCYYADNGRDEGVKKFSCKGVSRRHNEMNWERYRKALFGSLDKVTNIGFRKRDNHIVTYEQSKLGLSAYYDKRIVHEDGIHTSCL